MFKVIYTYYGTSYDMNRMPVKEVIEACSFREVARIIYERCRVYAFDKKDDERLVAILEYLSRDHHSGRLKVIDDLDIPVLNETLVYHVTEYFREQNIPRHKREWRWRNGKYTFRYDPVPNLRGPVRQRRMYRHRKMRSDEALLSLRYDDYGYHRHCERNWKKFRKTQWKG